MQKLGLILFSVLILITSSFVKSSEINLVKGKTRIIDGDTIEINNEKIRFGGINSPERNEVGFRLAKDKLIDKIDNNIVTCLREKNKDKYRRTVAECFVNGESLSSFMVKKGYACDYILYSKGKYAKEQQYAKANKLGIWKMQYNPSWEYKCRKK
tara:strand:- start:1172 stop:1636 length:465 start_codon:yes stop_codon:yes gene_type:complete